MSGRMRCGGLPVMEETLSTRFQGTFFHCDTAWREMLSSFAMTTSRFRSRISAIVGSAFFFPEDRRRRRRDIIGAVTALSLSDIGETSHSFAEGSFSLEMKVVLDVKA